MITTLQHAVYIYIKCLLMRSSGGEIQMTASHFVFLKYCAHRHRNILEKGSQGGPKWSLVKMIIFAGIAILNVEKTNPMTNSSFPAVPGQNFDS